MKQTIVIKVSMNSHKSRSKALKISVGISGVDSAALKGDDKNQIEVTGDGIDVMELIKSIRKNVGPADLISVCEKKEEKKEEEKKAEGCTKSQSVGNPAVIPGAQLCELEMKKVEIEGEPSFSQQQRKSKLKLTM